MIVKNEEANLPGCLTSARALVDEIVVVDTGSTDRTKEIAAGFGACVHDFPWQDDFAAARNESLRFATGKWIFWLDADDRLDIENRNKLRALFDQLGDENVAYLMKCRSTARVGATQVEHARLFRNDPRIRWQYRIHEQIIPSVIASGGTVQSCDLVIWHTGYEDPVLWRQKLARNHSILLLATRELPDDPWIMLNLGQSHLALGQPEMALPLLRRGLERSQLGDFFTRKLYGQLARCYCQLGQSNEAMTLCRIGLKLIPDQGELLFLESQLLLGSGDLDGAESCLRRLLEPGARFVSADTALSGVKAHQNLGIVYRKQKRDSEAEAQWLAVVELNPGFAQAWLALADLWASQGRDADIEIAIQRLQKEPHGKDIAAQLQPRVRPRHARSAPTNPPKHSLHQPLDIAVKHHQAGDLALAEKLYQEILATDPGNASAMHLLGLIAHQRGDNVTAIEYITAALKLSPDYAEAHNNLGLALNALGRHEEAEISLRRALHLKPDYSIAHNNLGLALKEQGNLAEATASYREALRFNPDYAEAFNNLGIALKKQGRLDEAIQALHAALRLKSDYATAHNNLGIVLKEQKKLDDAVASLQQALGLQPDYAEAHNNLGLVFFDQGKLDEALASLGRATECNSNFAEAHNNLGLVFKEQAKLDDALASLREALRIRPDYPEAHNNLGLVLQEQDNPEAAMASWHEALRLKPEYAEAHNNLASTFVMRGKHHEARTHYDEALRIDPGYANAHTNRALLALLLGDLAQGWEEYEWRWRRPKQPTCPFEQPMWQGESLAGRTILLHAEQGLGDTLQFVRYAPLVKAQTGGRVLLQCPASLERLMNRCPGIDEVVLQGKPRPLFDVHAPLLSLPRLMNTTSIDVIPVAVPYLHVETGLIEHWRNRLASVPGFRVGIAWRGNPHHRGDRWRSVSLARFASLAINGVSLVSLQKGPGSEQLQHFPGLATDLGAELTDLADTAAVLKNLDLVITVDTALAHLAGALAVKTWVALPYAPDWRWLLGRSDSPWYPSLRLFRQPQPGKWDDVFDQIGRALCEHRQGNP